MIYIRSDQFLLSFLLEKLKSNTKNTKMSSTHFPVVKFVGSLGKEGNVVTSRLGCVVMATLQDLKEVGMAQEMKMVTDVIW